MPLHKRVKLLVEIEVPESQADFTPSQWLYAGTHVSVHKMDVIETTDVVIEPQINERQRAFNEYKRVFKAAADKTQFSKILKFKNFGSKSVSVTVPGYYGRYTSIFTFVCENTTVQFDEWVQGPPSPGQMWGPTTKVTHKFELGKPTVIDELAAFIEHRLVEYKKHNRTEGW